MSQKEYKETTATRKIFSLKKRVRAVAGGTSASKTVSILIWLIDYALTFSNQTISVVSATMPHLNKGAIVDFLKILEVQGYYNPAWWNKSRCIYLFPNGSKVEFFSADQPGKVRGPRRDVLFVNEANNLSYESYDQLQIRTRSVIWLDWNPVKEFWFYTELEGNPEVDFITLTYKDNEELDPKIVKAIEAKRADERWWRVYGEGQLGEVEGRIYKGWREIPEVPHEARLERYGLDFGYSTRPAALVAVYSYNQGLIYDECLYQMELSNKRIAEFINCLPEKTIVIADSAEPKSIDELISYGIMVIPSQKGPGSVAQGIQYVQSHKIFITKRSTNLKYEYKNYLWMKDPKTEKFLENEPDKSSPHDALDAARYGTEGLKQGPSEPEKKKLFVLAKGRKPNWGR